MFPPILTNRTLNSTNLSTIDESQCSLSPKDATTSNIDTEPMADLNDAEQMLSVQAAKKQNKFFFTCPDIQREQSPERSDYSDYVDDDWSSIEDGENPRASREAQEAEIEDKYRSALNFLEEGNAERAVSIFSTLLLHPIMTKYHIPDWSAYDWKRAIADTPQKIVPNMAKLFFNINLAMIGLVEDPLQFYVQALSIRPDFKDLWFNCGQFAISRRDWRSAEFCMTQCEDEFRALEALSLIRYLNNDYFKCTAVLQRVFESCPEHQTGHVIRQLISESSPFWTECHSKLFSRDIFEFCVEKLQKDKILRNFETFQRECIRPDDKCSSLFFQRVTSSMPSWAPLTIKIKTEIKLVELGKLLCNIYDRIGESSSFAEQRVFFEIESQNHYVQRKIINFGYVGETEEKRLNREDSQPVSELDEQMELGSVEGRRQPSGSDELQAMDGDEFVETFLEQIALTEDSDGRAEGEAGNRAQIVFQDACVDQEVSNCNKNTKMPQAELIGNEPETQDELSLRRSMRLIDDLNYFGNSLQPRPNDALNRQFNVLTLMGFEDNDLEEQQIALSNHRHTVHFKYDSIVPQKLPSLDKLISLLIEQSAKETTKYPNTLRTFLGWVAFEQDPFMVLTLEEAETFREVYARWSGLCLGICPNTTADLAVHQLAAELGSHRALSILQAFYGRRFLKRQKTFSNLFADGEEEIVGKSHLADSFRGTTMQFAQKSLNADNDVFRWVFDRIHSEQQQLRRGESDRPTVIERNEEISANSDESQQSMDCPNSSTVRRQLEVRYKWLIANLLPEELCLPNSEAFHFIHAFSELNSALSLMEPHWTLWSHAEFDIGCLTARNLKEVLRKRIRKFQLQQIDYLIEAKRYEELKNVLLHQYDWASDSDDAHIKQMFLLIQCIRETDNSLTDIGLWISKILNEICRDDISNVLAKRSLRRCIHLLDELFPAGLFERSLATESFFAAVGYYLGKLVQPALYEKSAQCSDLWRWCSKIAKFREGRLNVSKLKAFYACDSALLDRRHPTKTTMLLAKGHEVLGKMKKCSRKEGMFLRLLIDEFLNTIRDPSVRLVLALPEYSDIRENVVSEIVQCLRCCLSDKFAQSRVRSNRVVDHGSKLQWPVDRDFATKVLELILPPKLPEICSDIRVPSDFADLLIKAFDHLLEVDETQLRCLDEMLQSPFRLELEEKFDSDGLCCGYEERLQMSEEGKVRLENLTKIGNAEGETNTFSEFSAKCVYLLAYFHYRTGSGSGEEWLRKCLAIGGRHLPPNILASAWYALGRSLTYSYAIKNDEELLDRVEAYVFPFRMALFLHWEFAESHLDVGTIIYQLRTRFARFKVQRDVSKELRCKTQQKVEGMLQKCKVHFRLALRFNDSPKDVAWLSNYFLAKIAEKLGDPPETVLDLYYRCALALEEEGIQYLTKINRIKQTYFEPLEIHYKVHAYAYRYLGVLNSPSFPPRTSFQCAKDLSTIHVYLKLFQHHGVQRRSMEDAHWSDAAFYEQPNLPKTWDRHLQPKSFKNNDVLREKNVSDDVEGEVADLIGSLVCASDLYFDIVRMCQSAFNVILQRFPHYKAFYRVARAFFDEKNFARCADILFDRLFLTGRKQKCNNFLENIVEIKRSDFERNGSFPYHLCKIVKLAVVASFKYDNIGRLKDLVVALTSYKPSSASREILGEPLVKELLGMASRGFKSLAEKQQKLYEHDMQQLGKLIEQVEGVIGKLKKDGRCQKERSALETTLIACIQRRDKMSQRSDGHGIDLLESAAGVINVQQLNRLSSLTCRSHHNRKQQQFTAKLPIGLRAPTLNASPSAEQNVAKSTVFSNAAPTHSQTHPLTMNSLASSSKFLQERPTLSNSTAIHQSQNANQKRLKPLDAEGFKMLHKILPSLGLNRIGLGMAEKLRILQALFERLGYEFPKEKAAETSRIHEGGHSGKGNSLPVMQLQTSECGPSKSKDPPPRPIRPPAQRMTGLPPNAKSKYKIKATKSEQHAASQKQNDEEVQVVHLASTDSRPSVISTHQSVSTTICVPNSDERTVTALSAFDEGMMQIPDHFVAVAAPSLQQKQQQHQKCAIGSTVGGPPSKVRRKDETLTENPSTSGSHIFPTKQSTKGVITLNGEKTFCRRVLETPQKPTSSSHVQSNSQALPSSVSLALARQTVQTNGPPSLSSAASSSPAHLDHFPGLPRSALSSMLATLTSQLNQQQPILNQQRQHPPIMTPTSTTSSSSSRQTQGQQQNNASLNYRNNEQQQPDLLFGHLLNLQRVEQLRQLSERFGLNWNGVGSQSQRK